MSFVDVFPIEPVMPTTRARLRSRTSPPIRPSAANASSGTSVAAAPRASASAANSAPRVDRDEEIARRDPPGVDLHAGERIGPRFDAAEPRQQ